MFVVVLSAPVNHVYRDSIIYAITLSLSTRVGLSFVYSSSHFTFVITKNRAQSGSNKCQLKSHITCYIALNLHSTTAGSVQLSCYKILVLMWV